jgi:hypothetical protein
MVTQGEKESTGGDAETRSSRHMRASKSTDVTAADVLMYLMGSLREGLGAARDPARAHVLSVVASCNRKHAGEAAAPHYKQPAVLCTSTAGGLLVPAERGREGMSCPAGEWSLA